MCNLILFFSNNKENFMINVNCCRDYADANNERQKSVEEFYKTQHTNQTLDFVRSLLYYNYTLRFIN